MAGVLIRREEARREDSHAMTVAETEETQLTSQGTPRIAGVTRSQQRGKEGPASIGFRESLALSTPWF